jgi:hypothetical protein
MAESSRFWATNATGDGIVTGFTVTHWQNFILKLFEGGDEVNGAVLRGVGSALLCTGAASPITVPTGAAIGYGYFYENDANVTHVVSTPLVGTTGGHIVLETNWAAQTVRTKMYTNTDGIGTPPALTQTAGTLWQTRLCTFTITTGGVITLTDARALAHFSTEITTAMLRDLNVTTVKLADLAVSTAKIADSAVTTAKLLDANVTAAKLAAGAALSNLGFTPWHSGNDGAGSGLDADLLDGQNGAYYALLDGQNGAFYRLFSNLTDSIAAAQIPNNMIDATKAGANVPVLLQRVGGNATDWHIGGNTAQAVGNVRIHAGAFNVTGLAAGGSIGTNYTTITAFGAVAMVFCSATDYDLACGALMRADKLNIDFVIKNRGASAVTAVVYWLAIGTE